MFVEGSFVVDASFSAYCYDHGFEFAIEVFFEVFSDIFGYSVDSFFVLVVGILKYCFKW